MPKRKQNQEPWQIRNERKRKKNEIPCRKRYLICTEGKTEAIHFDHYRSSTGPLIISLDKSDHKVSLVKKTIDEKNKRIESGEFDTNKPYEHLYKEIQAFRSIAIKRAKNLLKSVLHPESANPSTTVHLLVEKLISEPGYREEK